MLTIEATEAQRSAQLSHALSLSKSLSLALSRSLIHLPDVCLGGLSGLDPHHPYGLRSHLPSGWNDHGRE